ncbi:MAG: alpha/beta fold hydrolase [Cyanobacteria bacterium J06628_6]
MTKGRRLSIAFISLSVLVAAYLGICWHILNILITPERKSQQPPTEDEFGVQQIRPISFESLTDRTQLQGWLIPSETRKAIILLHGLHSHAWNCQTADLAQAYASEGFSVFLFDLRGHGRSEGDYLGLGQLEKGDLQAAVDVLLEDGFRPGQIGVHGTSYGAAVTLLAVDEIEAVGAVVADSAFADMSDVVSGELKRQTGLPPFASRLLLPGLSILGQHQYGVDITQSIPEESIGQIAPRPILLIHGDQDEVIPYSHGQRLQTAAAPQTELWTLPVKHVEGVQLLPECRPAPTRDAFLTKVTQFFDEHLSAGGIAAE